jgi:hypothetical protein
MYLLKMIPFLSMGVAPDTTPLEMMQAGREIENYCQQFNAFFHGNQILNAEVTEIVKKAKLEIVIKSSGGFISRAEVEALKKQASVGLTFGCQIDTFPVVDLTNQLSPIQIASIFHLPSISQSDRWSCGCWATFNSAAIKDILAPQRSILTSGAIKKLAQLYHDSIGGLDSTVDYVLNNFNQEEHNQDNIAEVERPQVGITFLDRHLYTLIQNPLFQFNNNAFILVHYDGLWPADILFREAFSAEQIAQNLNKKNALFQVWDQLVNGWVINNQAGALNFICRIQWPKDDAKPNKRGTVETVCHWILISLVKLRNRNPILLVLDSANSPIGSCGTSKHDITPMDYLIPLYQRFVAPYVRVPQQGKEER